MRDQMPYFNGTAGWIGKQRPRFFLQRNFQTLPAVGTGWHDTMVIQQEVNHAASMQAECIMLRPTRTKEEIDAAYADLRAEAIQSGILRSNPVL